MAELFIDKYKPNNLYSLDYAFQLTKDLKNLAHVGDLPHIIFQGIPGSGKKTRALLFLKEKFGQGVHKISSQVIELKYPNKTIELQLLYSNYHYHINPSNHGVYDRLIIQDFIKSRAQYRSVGKVPYHIIIIEDADKLTQEAQQSLRRTMEKYISICRFIFLTNREGSLIDAIQSRCIKLRVPAPSPSEIGAILEYISEAEGIEISPEALDSLVTYSEQNLSKAINYLQLLSIKNPNLLKMNKSVNLADFSEIEIFISDIIKLLFQGGNLGIILEFRNKVYSLLVHCVDPVDVLKDIFQHLLRAIPDRYFMSKYEIIKATDYYENTLRLGGKPIYHLEGYLVRLFHIVKDLQKTVNEEKKTKKPSTKTQTQNT